MALSGYKKSFWIVLFIAILVILIGGSAVGVYLIKYSAMSERLCGQCHSDIVQLWSASKGHPSEQTRCYECHSRGLRILPEEWNFVKHARDQLVPREYLADDDLTSQRCLDCHEEVLEFGYTYKKEIIKINHRFHREEGLECVNCHRTSGHEYMAEGTNRPTVAECLDCHRREFEGPPKNQLCLNCHGLMLVPGKQWYE